MMRGLAGGLLAVFIMLAGSSVYGQSESNANFKPINLDSLSEEQKALLIEYKDSFEDDLHNVLDVFYGAEKKRFDTTVYDMDRSSHVEIGLDFVSSNLINGRTTGISGVAFYPSITYIHKTGFYFALAPGFYTDRSVVKATAVPLISLSAGFQRTFFKRWFLGVGYSHNFITYGGTVSRRLLNNSLSFSTSVDVWKHLILGGSACIYWSSVHSRLLPEAFKFSAEVILTIRKEFIIYKFIGAKVFTIAPALNFYLGYDNMAFARQLGASEVKADSTTKKQITKVVVNKYFGFLDIEPSVTLDWRIRNFDISVVPTLAIPFNTLNTQTNTRVFNPKVYRFYVQAGVRYLFHVKKNKRKSVS